MLKAAARHLMRFRHFLVALKWDLYRYKVGNLMKPRMVREFKALRDACEAELLKITQDKT
jgi:hypothetical protein